MTKAIQDKDSLLLKMEATEPLANIIKDTKAAREKEISDTVHEKMDAFYTGRDKTVYKTRIKRIANDLQRRFFSTSDTRYVPMGLVQGVMDVCMMIDPTGKNQNTIAAEKYRNGREALRELKAQYDKMAELTEDNDYSSEYDSDFSKAIEQLANAIGDVQGIGWKTWYNPKAETIIGTVGESKRIDAIEINAKVPEGKKLM